MKTNHTVGPWNFLNGKGDVENAAGAGVCALYADETYNANGKLIAAAPDMLEALTYAAMSCHHPKCEFPKGHPKKCTCHVQKAKDAIKKATE